MATEDCASTSGCGNDEGAHRSSAASIASMNSAYDTMDVSEAPGHTSVNFGPRCVASTGDAYCKTVLECVPEARGRLRDLRNEVSGTQSNSFRDAQMSADGTTIVTYSEDLIFKSFVLPQNPCEPTPNNLPHVLVPYSVPFTTVEAEPQDQSTASPTSKSAYAQSYSFTPTSVQSPAFTLYPAYNLMSSSTTLALIARTDLPTRLTNALDLNFTHATYPWQQAQNEDWVTPHSLLFSRDGTRFVAGACSQIAIFDIYRDGQGPLETHKTAKSTRARRSYGSGSVSLTGMVSALAIDATDGNLAAGTTNRQVGIFDNEGSGGSVTSFSVADYDEPETQGSGITKLKWSPCGRYLIIAERLSDALLVYDVRITSKRLGFLKGRNAMTSHALGFDIVQDFDGNLNVWAGGTDGEVRIWKDVLHMTDNPGPDIMFRASDDAVSSTMVHPMGHVCATASGQRGGRSRSRDRSSSCSSCTSSTSGSRYSLHGTDDTDDDLDVTPDDTSEMDPDSQSGPRACTSANGHDNALRVWVNDESSFITCSKSAW